MNPKLDNLLESVKIVTTNVNEYLDKKWSYKINNNYFPTVKLYFANTLIMYFFIDTDDNLVYTQVDIYFHNQYDHNTLSDIINLSNATMYLDTI